MGLYILNLNNIVYYSWNYYYHQRSILDPDETRNIFCFSSFFGHVFHLFRQFSAWNRTHAISFDWGYDEIFWWGLPDIFTNRHIYWYSDIVLFVFLSKKKFDMCEHNLIEGGLTKHESAITTRTLNVTKEVF